jgi:D-amino-acid dehydrogenase
MARTVIVGAGIVGLSTAYYLARAGRAVVVLDREPVGAGASLGNAGLLSIGHYPLTRPGASWRGLKWMFNRSAPLYIKPRLDPALLWWLWDFHRHCNQAWLDRCMRSLCAMGFPSLALLEQVIADEGINCDYKRDGWLDVVMDPRNMPGAVAEAQALVPYGYTHRVLTGDELRRQSPCFRPEVAGAVLHTDSAHCDPGVYTHALAEACMRHGVEIRTDAAVECIGHDRTGAVAGVVLQNGETVEGETIVIAAGIWSAGLNASLGLEMPLQPARGYHVQLEGVPSLPATGCVLHEAFVAVTPMRDQLRLAGTLEIQPVDRPWMRNRLESLAVGARRYMHGIDQARTVAEWAGYRPCTSDGMPVIGAVPRLPGVFVGTGHAMMGMTLGPVTGRALADLVLGRAAPIDLSMCDPARYLAGEAGVAGVAGSAGAAALPPAAFSAAALNSASRSFNSAT